MSSEDEMGTPDTMVKVDALLGKDTPHGRLATPLAHLLETSQEAGELFRLLRARIIELEKPAVSDLLARARRVDELDMDVATLKDRISLLEGLLREAREELQSAEQCTGLHTAHIVARIDSALSDKGDAS